MSGVSEPNEEVPEYLAIMEELVNNQQLPTPQQHDSQPIFPVSLDIPAALQHNLQSPHRTIKLIHSDGHPSTSLIRGFYYQLLKLCFELEDQESSKDYLEVTKQVIFHQAMLESEELKRALKFLAHFFIMMEDQETGSFEDLLGSYHQIDWAWLTLLQSIASSESQLSASDNHIQQILSELCQFFECNLVTNHPFYRFEEADTYLFLEGEQIYLIFDSSEEEEYYEQGQREAEKIQNPHSQLSEQPAKEKLSTVSKDHSSNEKQQQTVKEQYSVKGEDKASVSVDEQIIKEQLAFEEKFQKSKPDSSAHLTHQEASRVSSSPSEHSAYFKQPQMAFNSKQSFGYLEQQTFTKTEKFSNPYESSPKITSPQNQYYYSPTPSRDLQRQGSFENLKQSKQINTSKNDTIINMFGDMLKSGKFESYLNEDPRSKRFLQSNEKILQAEEQLEKQPSQEVYPSFKKGSGNTPFAYISTMQQAKSVASSVNDPNSQSGSTIGGNPHLQVSIPVQRYPGGSNLRSQSSRFSNLQINNSELTYRPKEPAPVPKTQQISYKSPSSPTYNDDDDIFYKPKRTLKVISQVAASKQSLAKVSSDNPDDSKGSIYRQFSDTRILKLLRQPHKTKVQLMRNRYKGQHFNK